eukprot:PhM_4_TR7016/c0_g3_i1/m.91171
MRCVVLLHTSLELPESGDVSDLLIAVADVFSKRELKAGDLRAQSDDRHRLSTRENVVAGATYHVLMPNLSTSAPSDDSSVDSVLSAKRTSATTSTRSHQPVATQRVASCHACSMIGTYQKRIQQQENEIEKLRLEINRLQWKAKSSARIASRRSSALSSAVASSASGGNLTPRPSTSGCASSRDTMSRSSSTPFLCDDSGGSHVVVAVPSNGAVVAAPDDDCDVFLAGDRQRQQCSKLIGIDACMEAGQRIRHALVGFDRAVDDITRSLEDDFLMCVHVRNKSKYSPLYYENQFVCLPRGLQTQKI